MEFKSYGKTKHASDKGSLVRLLQHNPELEKVTWVASEKFDGTNMSVYFDEEGVMEFGSRNQKLALDAKHYDWQNSMLTQYTAEWESISAWCKNGGKNVRIYGELYGAGIQTRIDYGDKAFAPFHLEVDGTLLCAHAIRLWFRLYARKGWCPKIVAEFKDLEEALAFDVDGYSEKHVETHGRPIEGVMLEPMFVRPLSGSGRFKLKTQVFCDTMNTKRKKTAVFEELEGDALTLYNIYSGYYNENRLADLFSKEGPPTEMSDLGKYIKLLCTDAKDDFLDSEDIKARFCALDDKERKRIISSGAKHAVPLIKEAILS